MTQSSGVAIPGRIEGLAPSPSALAQALKGGREFARRKPLGAFGAIVTLTLILLALFAPALSPADPLRTSGADSLKPPGFVGVNGRTYPMGTDDLGRDVMSRVLWGARISLQVGLIAVGLGAVAGSFWGILSGYVGGKTDLVVQRVMDSIQAFPTIILALVMVAVLGNSIQNVMLAVAVILTPQMNRIVRGATLSIKENQYVEAALAIGCGHFRILRQHIFPNVTAPIIVVATVNLGSAIITEATLSFLGLGTPPPTPSWGGMLTHTARAYLEQAPWLAVYPGVAISLAVYGFNLLGDALRDVWDPRLRGR